MPLRAAPFKLPLPVPVPPTFEPIPDAVTPQMVSSAHANLRAERTKLVELSQYRMGIIEHAMVPSGRVPYSITQINDMIADQRAIVETHEMHVRELAAAVRSEP